MSLDWIYWAISWILLTWHSVWDAVVPAGAVLGTNWAWILSIIFLVVTVRVILFPVFVKQIKSQRAMQALSPKIKELQEKHKGDRETLQKEMMELYREEKANPLMGCLPMFLQIPVFLGLLHVLRRVQPDNPLKELYGWSAEQFNSASMARLFTAPISDSFNTGTGTTKVVATVLVLIMTATTYLTTLQMVKKTGRAQDPQQQMIQRLMLYFIPGSLLISGFIYPFPIGVVIYWVVNNLFSLAQQQWVLRKFPPPPLLGKDGKPVAAPARKMPQPAKPGLFGRSKSNGAQPEPKPAVSGKALAPKPGAKPVNPKKSRPAKRQG